MPELRFAWLNIGLLVAGLFCLAYAVAHVAYRFFRGLAEGIAGGTATFGSKRLAPALTVAGVILIIAAVVVR